MNLSGLLLFLLQRKKVLTFYDGEAEVIDAFADVIRYKMRQRIREEAETALADGEALLTWGNL